MPRDTAPATLTIRQLNRALLARQMLLARARVDPVTAIERLGALQAQWPPAPYVGLWSRLLRFSVDDLERALRERAVVKATLMRGTLHLVSAADYPAYAVATPEARRAQWATTEHALIRFFKDLSPATKRAHESGRGIKDTAKLHAEMLRIARSPRTKEDLLDLMVAHTKLPRELVSHLVWGFIAAFGGLVHVPESGMWKSRRSGELVAARSVLRGLRAPALERAVAHAVSRHLAAFGPATVDDISSWTSIRTPPIRAAIASMQRSASVGRKVRTFRDERGRDLYDLSRAPRPDPDSSAPVRYLPKWDSTMLAYSPAERARILPEKYRKMVIGKNGDIAQTFLVDGMVAGTWQLSPARDGILVLSPFGRVARSDRSALVEEGERLARFLAPDARSHAVRA